MICKNCGYELAPGAKFCSECGARVERIEPERPAFEEVKAEPVKTPHMELFEREEPAKPARVELDIDWGNEESSHPRTTTVNDRVSFDWSSVVDETRKRVTTNIRSPWESERKPEADNDILSKEVDTKPDELTLEEEIFRDAAASKPDRRRTETFIDIIKKESAEREGRVDAATKIFPPIDEPMDPAKGSAAYRMERGSYEKFLSEEEKERTMGYTDLRNDIIAELEKQAAQTAETPAEPPKPADHVPGFEEQLAYIRARREASHQAETAAEPIAEPVQIADEPDVPGFDFDKQEEFLFGDLDVETKEPVVDDFALFAEEPAAPAVEEPAVEPVFEAVEEPVVEIEEPVAEEPVVEIEEPVVELEPAVEEPVMEAEEPVIEEPVFEEPAVEIEAPAVEPEPVVEEPVVEVEAPVAEEPVVEETAAEEPAEPAKPMFEVPKFVAPTPVSSFFDNRSIDDELAEILGLDSVFADEPVVEPIVEPEPVVESVVEPIVEPEPVVEPVVEPIVEPEPVVEPVIEPIVEPEPVVESVVEPIVEPEPVVEPVIEPIVEPEPVEEPVIEPIVEPEPIEEPFEEPSLEAYLNEYLEEEEPAPAPLFDPEDPAFAYFSRPSTPTLVFGEPDPNEPFADVSAFEQPIIGEEPEFDEEAELPGFEESVFETPVVEGTEEPAAADDFDIEDLYLNYENYAPTKRTLRFDAITDEMIEGDLEADEDESDMLDDILMGDLEKEFAALEDVDEPEDVIEPVEEPAFEIEPEIDATSVVEPEPAYEPFEAPAEEPVEEIVAAEPIEEPVVEEPVIEEPAAETAVEEPVEEPAAEEPVDEVDAEIAALQARLAELLGKKNAPAPAVEPVEEIVAAEPIEEPFEEPVVEEPADAFVAEPIVEEVIEEPVEEPVIEEPAVEEPTIEIETPVIEEPVVEEPAVEEPVVEAPAVEEPVEEAPSPIELEIDKQLAVLGLEMPGAISLDFSEEPVSIPEEWQEKYAPAVEESTMEIELPAEEPEIPAPSIEMAEPEAEEEVPSLGIELVETDLPVEEPAAKAAEPVFDETDKPLSIEDELLAMGFDLDSDKPVYPPEQDLMFSGDATGTESAAGPEEEPAMTIEELERDLFGSNVGAPDDTEATRKIEKFFTLYKKNEEFQKLLDAEYEKLQGGSDYTKMLDVISEYDKNEEQNYSTQVLGPITTAKIRENIEMERKTAMMEAIKDEAVKAAAQPEAAPQPASPTDVTKVIEPAPQPEAAAKVVVPAAAPAAVAKEAAKAEQIEKNEAALAETEKEKGGALTVIAIIVAVLLALLLVAILILIIAPESSVAIFINSLIGKITGLAAVTSETEWLLL